MGNTVLNMSVSLDGYVSGENDCKEYPLGDGGEVLHHWMLQGDTTIKDTIDPKYHGFFNTTGENTKVVSGFFSEIGAMVFGRRTYDLVDGWGGSYPVRDVPVFVVSHTPPANPPKGNTRIEFVNNLENAIEQAREASGERSVGIAGGKIADSAIRSGVVDEIYLHIVPVLLGGGIKLFDLIGPVPVPLEQSKVVNGSGVLHVRYQVRKSDA